MHRETTSADRLVGTWRVERAEGGIDDTTPTDILFYRGSRGATDVRAREMRR